MDCVEVHRFAFELSSPQSTLVTHVYHHLCKYTHFSQGRLFIYFTSACRKRIKCRVQFIASQIKYSIANKLQVKSQAKFVVKFPENVQKAIKYLPLNVGFRSFWMVSSVNIGMFSKVAWGRSKGHQISVLPLHAGFRVYLQLVLYRSHQI